MLETLVTALVLFASGGLAEGQARVHVEAALAAQAKTDVPADLLLGMAWIESRYDSGALSYMTNEGRRTTVWRERTPPPGAKPTWYCGVLQVGGRVSWDQCLRLRDDIALNYMTAAEHINSWQRDGQCRRRKSAEDRLFCALQGYGGGYAAIQKNAGRYARHVLLVRARLQRTISRVNVG